MGHDVPCPRPIAPKPRAEDAVQMGCENGKLFLREP